MGLKQILNCLKSYYAYNFKILYLSIIENILKKYFKIKSSVQFQSEGI